MTGKARARFVLLVLPLIFGLVAAPARAADRGFVRMCTGYSRNFEQQSAEMTAQETRMFGARGFPIKSAVPPMVLEDLRASKVAGLPAINDIRDISVAVEDIANFSIPSSPFLGTTSDAIKITTATVDQYAGVTFHQGKIQSITPLKPADLLPAYLFARSMAAYMLLNDLLASDKVIPRDGCVNAVQIQLGSAPGIIPELVAAMLSIPPSDPKAENAALLAYRAFTHSQEARENKLTKQTIAKLGNSPDIQFVYRDPDSTIHLGPEFDVIRLSRGSVRTYSMLAISSAGKYEMTSNALCAVGNVQCGDYYVWP